MTHCSSFRCESSKFFPAYESFCKPGKIPPRSCAPQQNAEPAVRCEGDALMLTVVLLTYPDDDAHILHSHLWTDVDPERATAVLSFVIDMLSILVVVMLQ